MLHVLSRDGFIVVSVLKIKNVQNKSSIVGHQWQSFDQNQTCLMTMNDFWLSFLKIQKYSCWMKSVPLESHYIVHSMDNPSSSCSRKERLSPYCRTSSSHRHALVSSCWIKTSQYNFMFESWCKFQAQLIIVTQEVQCISRCIQSKWM